MGCRTFDAKPRRILALSLQAGKPGEEYWTDARLLRCKITFLCCFLDDHLTVCGGSFFIGENFDVVKAGERVTKTREWRVKNNMEVHGPARALGTLIYCSRPARPSVRGPS